MTDSTSNKLLFEIQEQIKTESIDIDALDHYSLHFLIKPRLLCVGVVDNIRGRYLLFETYNLQIGLSNDEDSSGIISAIIDDHPLLKANFWKNIRVSIQNRCFTLIPSGLFDKNNMADYLSQSIEYDANKSEVRAYKQLSMDAINVFACSKSLLALFSETYPGKKVEYIHETSAFIEGNFRSQMVEHENVFVSVEESQFTMVVIVNSKLQFCNIFSYKTIEDFVYYLMFAMKELDLDPENLMLTLWGEITHDSSLFKLIYKYVRFAEIGKRPKYLSFPYHFDELLDQRYQTLFLQHLCE